MSEIREVVILSGVRTAIGDYGGSLKDIPPSELGAKVVREAVTRAKIDPKDIGQCVFGNVIHTEAKDMYLSRVAALNGGLALESGALTLNRLCGSGMGFRTALRSTTPASSPPTRRPCMRASSE